MSGCLYGCFSGCLSGHLAGLFLAVYLGVGLVVCLSGYLYPAVCLFGCLCLNDCFLLEWLLATDGSDGLGVPIQSKFPYVLVESNQL